MQLKLSAQLSVPARGSCYVNMQFCDTLGTGGISDAHVEGSIAIEAGGVGQLVTQERISKIYKDRNLRNNQGGTHLKT